MPQSAVALIPSILGTATGALGLGGQMAGSKQQKKLLNQQAAEQQQAFQNLQQQYQKWNTMSPSSMAQAWFQLTQPVSANQATAVNNAVSPAMANMGLGQSAGQLAEAMAPQLAAFQGQNQAQALQALTQMNQLPAAIAGAQAGVPQSMGQFLQPPGQGGAGSMFENSLQNLLGQLPGPRMAPPGYTGAPASIGQWNSGGSMPIDWSQIPFPGADTRLNPGSATGFNLQPTMSNANINWGGNFGAGG